MFQLHSLKQDFNKIISINKLNSTTKHSRFQNRDKKYYTDVPSINSQVQNILGVHVAVSPDLAKTLKVRSDHCENSTKLFGEVLKMIISVPKAIIILNTIVWTIVYGQSYDATGA